MSLADGPTVASSPPAAPPPTVWLTLRYRDAAAAIDWLQRAFGFVVTARYDSADDPGMVDHAQLAWPEGGGIMLGSDRPTQGWAATSGHGAAYVVTAHPQEVYDRAVAAGADVVRPMTPEDYGSIGFAFADPEGNLWSFGTYAGEPQS